MPTATWANNVNLNSEKRHFKQQNVNFYGHKLTKEDIRPAADKLEEVKNISAPTNTKKLSSLLGLLIYLNRSSAKGEEYTAPLHILTKRNARFKWEDHHQASLDKIKAELSSAHILSYYDPDPVTTTILQCDASQEGLGAWLREVDWRHRQRENYGHGTKIAHRRRVSIFQYWKGMPGSNVRPWEVWVLSSRKVYLNWDRPLTTWTNLQKKKHRRSSCTTAKTSLEMPEIDIEVKYWPCHWCV